jgi:hypothetical protein
MTGAAGGTPRTCRCPARYGTRTVTYFCQHEKDAICMKGDFKVDALVHSQRIASLERENAELRAALASRQPVSQGDGWVKCSERLPEAVYGAEGESPTDSEDVAVLFEAGDSIYDIGTYQHDEKRWILPNKNFSEPDAEPIAWKSLA